jgi:hypothetical protein
MQWIPSPVRLFYLAENLFPVKAAGQILFFLFQHPGINKEKTPAR